jgi:hypothetical protein
MSHCDSFPKNIIDILLFSHSMSFLLRCLYRLCMVIFPQGFRCNLYAECFPILYL